MKTKLLIFAVLLLALGAGSPALAQGTAFTYQGRLNLGGSAANGNYHFVFALFNDPVLGNQLGPAVTNAAVTVSNGLFTAAVDFGVAPWTGQALWLQVLVRTNGGGTFDTLTPRQPVTPAPYAVSAGNALQLGGQSAYTFVAKAGDTMTGPLNLPAGGLSVGGSQLVAAPSGKVGIGTGNPANQLSVAGNADVNGSIYAGNGLQGTNYGSHAIRGDSGGNIAVLGINGGASSDVIGAGGVYGLSGTGFGVGGESTSGDGVIGSSQGGYAGHFFGNVSVTKSLYAGSGVQGTNYAGHGIRGDSGNNIAVLGINGVASSDVIGAGGVYGLSGTGFGVGGESRSGDGVIGSSLSGYAGHFYGSVRASGLLYADSGMNAVASRTGSWNNPIVSIENQNTATGTSPALRVVGNGDAPNGALSVSMQGTGLIARFGNAYAWVAALDTNGNWSATSFNSTSDRNLKENFKTISPRAVLEKVTALPISRWNYKGEARVEHLGPMAQDFYTAFNVGPDDHHIAMVDEGGVALAAIQGLNEKVESGQKNANSQIEVLELRVRQQDAQISMLKGEVDELKAMLRVLDRKTEITGR